MFDLLKLKTAHMFASSRRLAKNIRDNYHKDDIIEKEVEENIQKIEHFMELGGDPKDVYKSFDMLINKNLRDLYETEVYQQEENAELYILREEKDLKKLYKSLHDFFEHLKKANGEDKEALKSVIRLLNALYKEGVAFKDRLQKEFRKVRDQKKDRERFRDHLIQVRQEFHQRIAARHLKVDAKKHNKEENKEESEIKSLEHHLKKIEQLKNKQESTDKEKEELKHLITALGQDLGRDINLLKETLEDVATIIDYAVYHYFKAEDTEDRCEQLLKKIYSAGLSEHRTKDIKQMFNDFKRWQDGQERMEYRIGKKVSRQARNAVKHEGQIS